MSSEYVAFINAQLAAADKEHLVVGVSGGLDSAVVLGLSVAAVGAENVTALIMPGVDSNPEDRAHGELVCAAFGVTPTVLPLNNALAGVLSELQGAVNSQDALLVGNVKARLRMIYLYAAAQEQQALVAGTGNRSEELLGYFTKYGDGGVDILPIGNVYKSDLGGLARQLGVPDAIISKAPSAGLWAGQTDEDELGFSYAVADSILKPYSAGLGVAEIVAATGHSVSLVEQVLAMVAQTAHKRAIPPSA